MDLQLILMVVQTVDVIKEKDFKDALDQVIKDEDEVIVLYSGIYSFIHNLKFNLTSYNKLPKKILQLIEKKVGKERILFLPSFTGKFYSKNGFFDLKKSIDDNNGVLPKIALKSNYYRTPQPIHSYLVYGNTSSVKKLKLISSWGKKSLLEFFSKKNARICNLGLPWNKGCAYLHRFEEIYNVPWRYNKKFYCDIKKNGKKIGKCFEIKFCSSKNVPLKYDYYPFIKEIEKSKSFCKSKNKDFKFESIKVDCLNKIGKKIFSKNPWVIIKNKKKTENWIRYNKKKELFEMKIKTSKITSKNRSAIVK